MSVGPSPNLSGNFFLSPMDCSNCGSNEDGSRGNSSTDSNDQNLYSPADPPDSGCPPGEGTCKP